MPYPLEAMLAGLLLLVLSPVMLVVALLVALSSRGPVLYRQTRVGRGGDGFTLLKFRTMRVGPAPGRPLTIGADDRVTAVGHFLRAHRLDELPQLFNVL